MLPEIAELLQCDNPGTQIAVSTEEIRADPYSFSAYLARAKAHLQAGYISNAEFDIRKAQEIDANRIEGHVFRAAMHYSIGQFKTALDDCVEALERNPLSEVPFIIRCACYLQLNRPNDVLANVERARKQHPKNAELVLMNARALVALRRYHEALEAATLALEMNPNLSGAYQVKSQSLNALGRYSEALVDGVNCLTKSTSALYAFTAKAIDTLEGEAPGKGSEVGDLASLSFSSQKSALSIGQASPVSTINPDGEKSTKDGDQTRNFDIITFTPTASEYEGQSAPRPSASRDDMVPSTRSRKILEQPPDGYTVDDAVMADIALVSRGLCPLPHALEWQEGTCKFQDSFDVLRCIAANVWPATEEAIKRQKYLDKLKEEELKRQKASQLLQQKQEEDMRKIGFRFEPHSHSQQSIQLEDAKPRSRGKSRLVGSILSEPQSEEGNRKRSLSSIGPVVPRSAVAPAVGAELRKSVYSENAEARDAQWDVMMEGIKAPPARDRYLSSIIARLPDALLFKVVNCNLKSEHLNDTLSQSPNVIRMDFSDNLIRQWDDLIELCPHLLILDMSHNPVEAAANLSFLQHMTRLREVVVNHCHLQDYPLGVQNSQSIEVLDIAYNDIFRISEFPSPLREFNACHNKLVSVPATAFMSGYQLRILRLSHNNLRQLPSIEPLKMLEQLHIDHNKLTSLPDMGTHRNLRVLNASHNEIGELPWTFSADSLPSLSDLNLGSNQLKELGAEFATFQLDRLDVSNNPLVLILDNAFQAGMLEYFNAADCRLSSLPPSLGSCPIGFLDVSNNEALTSFPPELAAIADSLQSCSVKGVPLNFRDTATMEIFDVLKGAVEAHGGAWSEGS